MKIILDKPADAATNMLRYRRLFEDFEAGKIPPTFRIYSWSQPAVTYGYRFNRGQTPLAHSGEKNVENYIKDVCPRHFRWRSLALRPTGGGIVFHQPGEITFAVALPRRSPHYADNLLESYFFTSNIILKFLKSLGINAEIKVKKFISRSFPPRLRRDKLQRESRALNLFSVLDSHFRGNDRNNLKFSHQLCFAEAAPHEIILDGKKIVGIAQCRFRNSFCQQGTIQGIKLTQTLISEYKLFLEKNL